MLLHSDLDAPRPLPIPELSVVLATPDVFATVALTMSHLRVQTALEQIELIVVAPRLDTLKMPERLLEGFAKTRVVECGENLLLCEIKAFGAKVATGKAIVFAEDHCFPAPDWAQQLIEAHSHSYAAVGPSFCNANPRTSLSWQDYLLNFGDWTARNKSKEVEALPWHNTSYKREILLAYGERLSSMLAVEGLLMEDLKKQGHKLYLANEARVYHVNTSRPLELIQGFFYSGWLFSALRSRSWSPPRRALQIAASPLVPWLRLPKQVEDLRRNREAGFVPQGVKLWSPLLVIGSAVHVLGEAFGCLFGPGATMRHKSEMEAHRIKRLARVDLRDIEQREKDVEAQLTAQKRTMATPAAVVAR